MRPCFSAFIIQSNALLTGGDKIETGQTRQMMTNALLPPPASYLLFKHPLECPEQVEAPSQTQADSSKALEATSALRDSGQSRTPPPYPLLLDIVYRLGLLTIPFPSK